MPYARAMASGEALPNRCPPGDVQGLERLSSVLGMAPMALDLTCGVSGPRLIAVIDIKLCIGCTKCIPVCPTDAIVGGPKLEHWVVSDTCTGCELCLPPCPVSCISFATANDKQQGYSTWLQSDADQAKVRYERKLLRVTQPTAKVEVSNLEQTLSRARNLAKQRLLDSASNK